jgi:hypothetical protein
MGCLIGAMTFFNRTKGEQSYITFPGLVSTKIDVWLNGQANDPVFKWCLRDLQINVNACSYFGDNRIESADRPNYHFRESNRCRLTSGGGG